MLLPIAAAICVALGWYVLFDYERVALGLAAQAPQLLGRLWNLRLMMGFVSVGGLGLAWLASRDARKRRVAECALERLNAELAQRVELRTSELRVQTKALQASRLREQLREKEAEVAFQAGLVEAAGAYLHGVGNALSSLELELLRLGKARDGAQRLEAVFEALSRDVQGGRIEEASHLVSALREAVLGRTFPRLEASWVALSAIKERMADELEARRGEFERRGQPVRYFQSFRVDRELAAILDRLPRVAGSDPVTRDINVAVTVHNRKHPFISGLASLLRQTLEAASGRITIRLRQEPGPRAVVTVEGADEEGLRGPIVASFIDFLNENNGTFRFEPACAAHPALLEVCLGDTGEPPPFS